MARTGTMTVLFSDTVNEYHHAARLRNQQSRPDQFPPLQSSGPGERGRPFRQQAEQIGGLDLSISRRFAGLVATAGR